MRNDPVGKYVVGGQNPSRTHYKSKQKHESRASNLDGQDEKLVIDFRCLHLLMKAATVIDKFYCQVSIQ